MFLDSERKQKEAQYKKEGRLPPWQSLTLKWPVLHEGDIPRFDPERWDFQARGLVENPLRLSWQEFLKLPQIRVIAEMARALKEARYVMVHADPATTCMATRSKSSGIMGSRSCQFSVVSCQQAAKTDC